MGKTKHETETIFYRVAFISPNFHKLRQFHKLHAKQIFNVPKTIGTFIILFKGSFY